jgi:7-cyano-7-deazaguanine synthase
MPRSIILLSAGLDSVVAFKMAYDKCDEVLCISYDYGQRAKARELEYASKICAKYHVKHVQIPLPWFKHFSGALTNKTAIPKLSEELLENFEITTGTAKAVWVPARNLVFLAIAASFCENYDYDFIITGFNREEGLTFPDNSISFINLFNDTLKYGALKKIEVKAPLIKLNKYEIAKLGLDINAPIEWSWSCYTAQKKPCGVCEACVRRRAAFNAIPARDPLFTRLDVISDEKRVIT